MVQDAITEKRGLSLKQAIDQIEKQFGKGSIMKLGDSRCSDIDCVSTGCLSLDLALGGKGLPRGRVIEVFGPEGSGKTTLCLSIIGEVQKNSGVCAYIDAEHALDPVYAKKIGVNVDELLISQPDYGEQALSIAESLVRSNGVDVVVIDSVAALVPKTELEGGMGDVHVALQARLMSQALRKLCAAVSKSKSMIIFINQIREKIGVMFGNPETTPGGRALKFYSSVRLDIRRVTILKDSEKGIGTRVRVNVVKNKVAPPFKRTEFDLLFERGISHEGDLLDLADQLGVISKSGNWFIFKKEKIGQGRENATITLQTNEKIVSDLEAEIKKALGHVNGSDEKKEKKEVKQ